MTAYIRNLDSDTWHFCKNCHLYPKSHSVTYEIESDDRPPYGELCNECLAKEERGDCASR